MYQKGSRILLADLNSFLATAGAIYGVGSGDRGYGQTGFSTAAAPGGYVTAEPWVRLRSMIAVCAAHQGTSITTLAPSSEFAARSVVKAHETEAPSSNPYDINGHVAAIDANRLVASASSMQIVSGVHSVSRASSWAERIETAIDATFASEDAARYFFNSGGEIRLRFNHPTGTSQDQAWREALETNVGTIRYAAHATTNTGTRALSQSVGYYETGTADTVIYNGTDIINSGLYASAYGANDVVVSARVINRTGTNGGNGSTIRFTVTLNDSHSNVYFDNVSAGTTVNLDLYRANVHLTIAAPIFSTAVPF